MKTKPRYFYAFAFFFLCGIIPMLGQSSYDKLGKLSNQLETYALNNNDSVRLLFPKLKKMSIELDQPEVLAKAFLARAYYEAQQNQLDTALTYGHWAVQIGKRTRSPKMVAEAHITLANLYLEIENFQTARAYADSVLTAAIFIDDENLKIRGLASKASIYIFYGMYFEALPIINEALKHLENTPDELVYGRMLGNKAECYLLMAQYDSTLSLYYRGITALENQNDPIALASMHTSLASAYIHMGELEKASRQIDKAQEIYKRAGYGKGKLELNLLKGRIFEKEGYLSEAISLLSQTAESFKLSGENTRWLSTSMEMVGLLLRENRVAEAENLLKSLEEAGLENSLPRLRFETLMTRAELALRKENYSAALAYLEKAFSLANRNFSITSKRDVLALKAKVHEALENYRQANEVWQKYVAVNDSINANLRSLSVSEMQERYESFQKEQENFALRQESSYKEEQLENQRKLFLYSVLGISVFVLLSILLFWQSMRSRNKSKQLSELNERLEKQAHDLEEVNQLKDRLFSIIAHDLRSPLNNLHDFIQIMEYDDLEEHHKQAMMGQLKNRFQSVTALVDNLLNWARLQVNENVVHPTEVDLFLTVNETADLLRPVASQKNIEIVVNVQPNSKVLADENAVRLLARNFLNNAIKFSNKNASITIDARKNEEEWIVAIKDEGVGIPAKKLGSLFESFGETTRGTSNEKGSGIGLTICREYAEKNGGRVWAESTLGEGSTFFFALPLYQR